MVEEVAGNDGLRCKGWLQEAVLRMLENNLHPDVAERPEDLVVYGGTGKAARNKEALAAIKRSLMGLEGDETLWIQSGKPVGVVRTHPDAPRVLIANSHLVPAWANWEEFRRLEEMGLTMYGQMTAGSWIYIGTQGILQGTFETFAALARKVYGDVGDGDSDNAHGPLTGRFVLTGGCGGMGGAQPLAVTMNGGAVLISDVDVTRLEKRVKDRYLDRIAPDLQDAVNQVRKAADEGKALSVGVVANAADVVRSFVDDRWGFLPDIVTDQTSAHDELVGYYPSGHTFDEARELRDSDPSRYRLESFRTMKEHCEAMAVLSGRGVEVFDYGNNLRGQAVNGGGLDRSIAFSFPGFVPAYIRPLFCLGKGPFRWAALSGDPYDIAVTDRALLETFPDNPELARWIPMAAERVAYQGLPSRICWLGYGERARFGQVLNELVRSGAVKAPIVIGRDHLDSGSVASPYRETESMKDGSDAIADWPLLNAMTNVACGATWVSIHHGGGVGIGNSIHSGVVIVADGTDAAAVRLERVLTADPQSGVLRHADAGYEEAVIAAREHSIRIPMLE